MTPENWIEVGRTIVDLFKTIIPFATIAGIFYFFREEIKILIKNGGLRVSGPGFSLETSQRQQERVGKKEKKEIKKLNTELENAKQVQKKLEELQEYTTRDKNTFFLGYHFEKTYRLIFPTQMLILNIMDSNNGEITESLARSLHLRTIWANNFNVSFDQFIGFMIQTGLIFYDEISNKYTLAPIGKTFWEYIKNEKIPLKIPANDVIETQP